MAIFNGHEDTLDSYFNDIKDIRSLTKEEEVRLSERIKAGDNRARDLLVRANLKFVVSVAKHYKGCGVPFSDLISEGNIGLLRAADRFDAGKGVKFISFAVMHVKGAITECIERYLKNAEEEVIASGVKGGCYDEGNWDISDNYSDQGEEEETHSDNDSRDSAIQSLMACLDEKERHMLTEYYGLGTNKAKTLREIGSEYGITSERVRQILNRSVDTMRHNALMSDEFEVFKSLR